MHSFADDIFTEPEDVDPDTLANLGPLTRDGRDLGRAKGVDVNPKADGPERRVYVERIELQPIDPQANGPQLFYGLRYHVDIRPPGEVTTFHDQVGYWLWEPKTGLVMQTLTIPRGQVAMAAGHAAPDDRILKLSAARGSTEYGVVSTAFLEWAFRTDAYAIEVTFNDDGGWSYVSDTMLKRPRTPRTFLHRDRNTLVKVGEPTPNRLKRRMDGEPR